MSSQLAELCRHFAAAENRTLPKLMTATHRGKLELCCTNYVFFCVSLASLPTHKVFGLTPRAFVTRY